MFFYQHLCDICLFVLSLIVCKAHTYKCGLFHLYPMPMRLKIFKKICKYDTKAINLFPIRRFLWLKLGITSL